MYGIRCAAACLRTTQPCQAMRAQLSPILTELFTVQHLRVSTHIESVQALCTSCAAHHTCFRVLLEGSMHQQPHKSHQQAPACHCQLAAQASLRIHCSVSRCTTALYCTGSSSRAANRHSPLCPVGGRHKGHRQQTAGGNGVREGVWPGSKSAGHGKPPCGWSPPQPPE